MSFSQTLHDVLQDNKYDHLTGRAFDFEGFIQRILQKIMTAIINFFSSLLNLDMQNNNAYNTNLFSYIFLGLGILLFLLIMCFVIFFITRQKKRMQQSPAMNAIFQTLQDKRFTYSDFLNESNQFAATGHYREAVRYRYIALLWIFSRKKILTIDSATTNSQIKKEISEKAWQFSKTFHEIVDVFQQTWFGHKSLNPDAYSDFSLTLDQLAKEVINYEKTV